MHKNICFLALILVLFVNRSSGQDYFRDGFVILNNGDTLRGEVEDRNDNLNYKSCIFRTNGQAIKYSPNQIQAFGYDEGQHFSAGIIDNKFAEVLVAGKLGLYREKSFIMKKNGEALRLISRPYETYHDTHLGIREDNKWRGIVAYFINDCYDNPHEKVTDLHINERQLTRITIQYNKCASADYKVYKHKVPWLSVRYGISLGMVNSYLHKRRHIREYEYIPETYNTQSPYAGFTLEISSPRVSDRMSFLINPHVMRMEYADLVELSSVSSGFHQTHINVTKVALPVAIKYTKPFKDISLSIEAGILADYKFGSDTKHIYDRINQGVITSTENPGFLEITKNQFGYWGGLGLQKDFAAFAAELSLRYYTISRFDKEYGILMEPERFAVNLTLYKL